MHSALKLININYNYINLSRDTGGVTRGGDFPPARRRVPLMSPNKLTNSMYINKKYAMNTGLSPHLVSYTPLLLPPCRFNGQFEMFR
jgi:hypothetical protein